MKDIKGYEGIYAVTSCGKVWSHKRHRFMKLTGEGGNYKCVNLSKNGRYKTFLVHRLVAEAYIPNPDNLPQVNHKNEKKDKNNVQNLEWCTAEYNLAFSKIWAAKRRPVYCIELDKVYRSQYAAAKELQIAQPNLCTCLSSNGKYTVGGYHFRYVE